MAGLIFPKCCLVRGGYMGRFRHTSSFMGYQEISLDEAEIIRNYVWGDKSLLAKYMPNIDKERHITESMKRFMLDAMLGKVKSKRKEFERDVKIFIRVNQLVVENNLKLKLNNTDTPTAPEMAAKEFDIKSSTALKAYQNINKIISDKGNADDFLYIHYFRRKNDPVIIKKEMAEITGESREIQLYSSFYNFFEKYRKNIFPYNFQSPIKKNK